MRAVNSDIILSHTVFLPTIYSRDVCDFEYRQSVVSQGPCLLSFPVPEFMYDTLIRDLGSKQGMPDFCPKDTC